MREGYSNITHSILRDVCTKGVGDSRCKLLNFI